MGFFLQSFVCTELIPYALCRKYVRFVPKMAPEFEGIIIAQSSEIAFGNPFIRITILFRRIASSDAQFSN